MYKNCLFCELPRPADELACQVCGGGAFGTLDPNVPEDFALRLISEDRWATAYEYLEERLIHDEENGAICHALGWLALAIGDPRAVETWCHEALRLAPDCADAHILLGQVLESQKRWEEAEAEYLLALKKPSLDGVRRELTVNKRSRVATEIPEF